MSSLTTLLALADSRLPTGGHVHSGGVEEAVTSRLVVDLETLEAYLRRRIRTSGLVTASVAAAVHRDDLTVAEADAETDARTPSPAARGPPALRAADCCGWRGGSGPHRGRDGPGTSWAPARTWR